MKKLYFFVAIIATMLSVAVKAQYVIAGWNLKAYGTGNNTISGSLNATNQDPNISTPLLARGNGLTSSDVNFAYFSNVTSTSSTGNTAADAINNGDFYTVNLKAANGNMNITKINYQLYRSANGPNTFRWAYSIDGAAFVNLGSADIVYTGTESLGLVQASIDLSGISALQNIPSTSTVVFRLLGWGATSGTRRFGIGRNSSGSDNSFVLSFEGSLSTTLPIQLTSFTAKAHTNSVQLNWQTATEQNNSHFEILRSKDGTAFQVIGFTKGNGTTISETNYSFTDSKPILGAAYYALKQYDVNGENKYYDPVVVRFSVNKPVFNVFANSNGLALKLEADKAENAEIYVSDITGKRIGEKQWQLNEGLNQIEIRNLDLKAGILYIVSLKSANINQSVKVIR